MENEIIKLELTIKHVNIVLAHLSKGIYADVIEAINLITGQGNPQIAALQNPPKSVPAVALSEEAPVVDEPKPEVVN